MDKYEYKIKSEEIKELITQKEYARAADIADTIDWRRVKSVTMLCTISDLYKVNRRYEDSRDLLLLAYDRHPGGRTIVYALCELSIKTGEIPQAVEYCKEFVNIAPRDPGRYILQYKIYEAQGVSLEERIEVLEELKKHDYREKWAYELAYLYHRVGLASKCVDECDEMIVWFGDGKYVIKAMELKMLHQPLTLDQQYKYDRRFAPVVEEVPVEESVNEDATVMEEIPQEMYESAGVPEEEVSGSTAIWSGQEVEVAMVPLGIDTEATKRFPVEEINIQVKTMDPGNEYNTINLQAELAAGLKEILENEKAASNEEITRAIMAPMMQTDNIDREEVTKILQMPAKAEEPEVTAEESEGLEQEPTIIWKKEEVLAEAEAVEQEVEVTQEESLVEEELLGDTEEIPELMDVEEMFTSDTEEIPAILTEPKVEEVPEQEPVTTGQQVMEQMRRETVEPPKEMAKVLSMEGDGQLTFLVEEKNTVEQQITGQLSIEDIMAEWERMKKELEEKGKEKVRQHVKENTGQMFTEFEASIRDGLLEQLEGGRSIDSVIAEAEGRSFEEVEEELPVPKSLQEDDEEPTQEDYEDISIEEAEAAVELEAEESLTTEDVVEELEEIQEAMEENSEEEAEVLEVEESEELYEEPEEENEEEPVAEEIEETTEESETEEAEEATEEPEIEETEEATEEPETEEAEEATEESETEETEESDKESEDEEAEDSKEENQENTHRKAPKVRNLTREERELFAPFIQGRSSREQLVKVLDTISMDAYTGNVIVTGAEGLDTLGLARSIVQDVQGTDSNFSGKTAKISGEALNKRNVNEILGGLQNGALIIQRAHNMNAQTVEDLYKALQQENSGIIIVMEGVRKLMDTFLSENTRLGNCFTARMDMEALSDAALVAFCKKYAKDNEFVLDELAVLALHQIITDRQTNDHAVTIMEVKEIMEDAMDNASRKSVGHFIDILTGKRYDEEDMIIIHEKDLM